MTENDFWKKYFKADFLYRTKNALAAAAEAAEDEELAVFLKKDEIVAEESRRKVFFYSVSFFQLCILTLYMLTLSRSSLSL